jgi:hypothetical protein
MYIVGIDPSLSSSAISIYKDGELYLFNYTNNKKNNKWVKESNHLIDFSFHNYVFGNDFSDSEIEKLNIYDEVTQNLVDNIKSIVGSSPSKIYMEGYSYSSKGKIIDLVAFSTLIRYKLSKIPNAELTIIPPSSLKKYIGEFVYAQDKKGVFRNEEGKAAGSFDKKDMMIALLKLKLKYPYTNYLNENKDILLNPKNIPKPFDDINDSVILAYYGCISNNLDI